jgi:hypothetical protein
MSVQDDAREQELCNRFNLNWDPSHERGGCDASYRVEVDGRQWDLQVEVKSTTRDSVSTARDVSMSHIAKWRRMFFVIGYYRRGVNRAVQIQHALCLTPGDMEPWIADLESRIATDFRLAEVLTSRTLALADLFAVCTEKPAYSLADAKQLHKQQWSAAQYAAARDIRVGRRSMISQTGMLELLRLRSKYIADRGATLNNPHITKTHLQQFLGTDRQAPNARGRWSEVFEKIAADFVRANPGHPAVIAV